MNEQHSTLATRELNLKEFAILGVSGHYAVGIETVSALRFSPKREYSNIRPEIFAVFARRKLELVIQRPIRDCKKPAISRPFSS